MTDNENSQERWLVIDKKTGKHLGIAEEYPFSGYAGKARKDVWVKRLVACRSCGAYIVFVASKTNKMIPVNSKTWHGEFIYDHKIHVSHFATCPDAGKWRKKT